MAQDIQDPKDQKIDWEAKAKEYEQQLKSYEGLKKNRDDLLNENKVFKEERAAREAEAAKQAEEAARKAKDIETLEKSWQDKVNKTASEKDAQIGKLKGFVQATLIDNQAQSIANEIGLKGSEALLLPHIKARLAVEERDGKYVTVVKDANGQPSALSLTELKEEFQNNPAFAPVIVGSKASGSGAAGNPAGGSATAKKPQEMNDAERVALFKENPERFRELFGRKF